MSATPAVKTARSAPLSRGTAINLLPPAQIESFVYRSIEFTAETARPATAVHEELHPGVYGAFVLCWVALFGIFALTFLGSPFTMFMVAVGAFTGLMYFAVPVVLSRQSPAAKTNATFAGFLRGKFDTMTGPVTGAEALLHVILVPAALSAGAAAIGVIIAMSRIGY
jgi:hypothetical protein